MASSIWRLFAESFDGAEIAARKNMSISWADKPFSFYNSIFLTGRIEDASELETTVDKAFAVTRRKQFPGLISVCRDLLSESVQAKVDSILSEKAYATAMPVVGMTAEPVWPNNWKVLRRRRFQLPSRLPVHPAW